MIPVLNLTTAAMAVLSVAPAGKRGLAWPWYNENTNLDPGKLSGAQVQWMYNWETWRPAKTPNLNFIGTQATMNSGPSPIDQLQTRAAQQGWNTVFSLNEPDLNGISPGVAADWYIRWINPLAIKKAIPSVTSSQDAGKGLNWAAAFLGACNGRCYFDYINLHWYGNTFAEFKAHIQEAHNRFPNYKACPHIHTLKT
ncbi:hypothetical protein FRC10_011043 [Ceratobasidium sp. 414]|nr:hypothetical protein FRC10_011043 [Ceratobasidium sp. 414]